VLKTLKLLRDNPLIRDFEIVDFKSGEDFYYLKIKAEISNATTLFIDVNIFQTEYNYSYHWQNIEGNLLMRWDNSPHHKGKTFPHHKHLADGKIVESYEINLEKVLGVIQKLI